MSQQNVEAFKRGVEAYNQGDVEPIVEVSHREIDWYPLSAEVEGGVSFRGHPGLRQWFANLRGDEPLRVRDDAAEVSNVINARLKLLERFRTDGILNTEAGYLSRSRMRSSSGHACTHARRSPRSIAGPESRCDPFLISAYPRRWLDARLTAHRSLHPRAGRFRR